MIRLEALNEAPCHDALQKLEALLGPLPQAELLEPWEPGDPVVLRVDLPGLGPADAARLRDAGFDILPGLPPGARTARDQDAVVEDEIAGGGRTATLWSDAIEGGLCLPDFGTEDPDPAGGAVASELIAGLRAVSAELVPDVASAVDFVRHRTTGRQALRLTVPQQALAGLEGEALLTLRRDVIAAVAEVVDRRPAELHSELGWDPRLGFSVIVWRRGSPGPALPGDSVVERGLSPAPEALRALDLAGRVHAVEVQVVPSSPAMHHPVIEALLPLLEGSTLQGAEPRWVYARGVGPAFCPTWRAPAESLADLSTLLPDLLVDGVHAIRVVPVQPVGLEDVEPFLDPAWRWLGARWVARWRDGVRDRDRLVAWVPRDPDPADHALIESIATVLGRGAEALLEPDAQGRLVRPIVDDTGRPGLALHGPPELATDPMRLSFLLGLLGSVPLPICSDLLDLALPVDGVVLHLWRRSEASAEGRTPAWVSVG